MKLLRVFSIVPALAALLAIPVAHGGQIALTFSGGSTLNDSPTVGWRFLTAAPITITALGFYDQGGDGLTDSHQVAIWTSAGALQGSVTVPAGTVGTLDNGFRFAPASFSLAAGDYVVAGDKPSGSDLHLGTVLAGNTTLAPGITYLQNRYGFDGGAFSFPAQTFGGQERGYFGGNFQFDAAVPEPATWSFLLIGAIAMFLGSRRSRRAH